MPWEALLAPSFRRVTVMVLQCHLSPDQFTPVQRSCLGGTRRLAETLCIGWSSYMLHIQLIVQWRHANSGGLFFFEPDRFPLQANSTHGRAEIPSFPARAQVQQTRMRSLLVVDSKAHRRHRWRQLSSRSAGTVDLFMVLPGILTRSLGYTVCQQAPAAHGNDAAAHGAPGPVKDDFAELLGHLAKFETIDAVVLAWGSEEVNSDFWNCLRLRRGSAPDLAGHPHCDQKVALAKG